MTITSIFYSTLISLALFTMAGAPANEYLDKTHILKFILEQLKTKVSTQQMKQSVRVVKGVLQYVSELDMQHQRSLKRLVCMVGDLNDQMANISKSYYHEKTKVKDLNNKLNESQQTAQNFEEQNNELSFEVKDLKNKLNESQQTVQNLEDQNNKLSFKVESMQIYINFTRQCEKRPNLQKIKEVVQRYINDSDWTTLERNLLALLDHNSEEYTQLHNMWTPTLVGNKDYNQLAILLLCAGLPVNETFGSEYELMHLAANGGNIQMLKLLLGHGADVNARGFIGLTPLMMAAFNGHLEAVKWLVQAGADISARDNHSETALDMATYRNHAAVAKYLEPLTN